jgi:hypothetical protein
MTWSDISRVENDRSTTIGNMCWNHSPNCTSTQTGSITQEWIKAQLQKASEAWWFLNIPQIYIYIHPNTLQYFPRHTILLTLFSNAYKHIYFPKLFIIKVHINKMIIISTVLVSNIYSISRIIFMIWLCQTVRWQIILYAKFIKDAMHHVYSMNYSGGNSASKLSTVIAFPVSGTPEVYKQSIHERPHVFTAKFNLQHVLWGEAISKQNSGLAMSAQSRRPQMKVIARSMPNHLAWPDQRWREGLTIKKYIVVRQKKKLE